MNFKTIVVFIKLLTSVVLLRTFNKHNVFTEGVNKICLSANGDKRKQWIGSIGKYAYRTSKGLVCKKEELKCNNTFKQYKNC